MRNALVSVIILTSLLITGTSFAKERFGVAHELVISSDLELSLQYRSHNPPNGGNSSSTVYFNAGPAIDFFITNGLSIGGKIALDYAREDRDVKRTGFSLAPRLGYAIPIGDTLAFWPKMGFSINYETSDYWYNEYAGFNNTRVAMEIYAPFVIGLARHFFIGMGPNFSVDLISRGSYDRGDSFDTEKDVVFGVNTVIGGYF